MERPEGRQRRENKQVVGENAFWWHHYKHKMKYGRMFASMKWRYLGYLQLLSKAKHYFTVMAKKEVCPRDEIADPSGTAMLLIDRHGFAEGLVSFRTLCGLGNRR